MQLWCRILYQMEHQLNLLCKSIVVPIVSAYNANPFVPLGTAIEMHVTLINQRTYEAHTKTSLYVGNPWEHYWCYGICIVDTRSVHVGESSQVI